MLKQAKIKLKNLIYDDSGVAMAYTIMVFLFFFLLCVSTYAMTENIRQKIELQNACDAAAYSGAVVQADMLSRLAVLNRALSWTYLQTNRRQMDYLVGEFAIAAKEDHTIQSAWVLANNSGCPLHWISGVNYYACSNSSGNYHIKMMSHPEPAGNVSPRGNVSQLLRDIDTGKNNLTKIKNAMTEIKAVMNECIALFLTSFLFSIAHFYLVGIPGLFFLAMILQLLYLHTRNLWCPIQVHMIFNALSVIAVLTSK